MYSPRTNMSPWLRAFPLGREACRELLRKDTTPFEFMVFWGIATATRVEPFSSHHLSTAPSFFIRMTFCKSQRGVEKNSAVAVCGIDTVLLHPRTWECWSKMRTQFAHCQSTIHINFQHSLLICRVDISCGIIVPHQVRTSIFKRSFDFPNIFSTSRL